MNLSRLQSADDLTELRDVSVDEVVAAAIDRSPSPRTPRASRSCAAARRRVRARRRAGAHRGDRQPRRQRRRLLAAGQVGVGVGRRDVVEIAVTDRGIGIPRASSSASSSGSTAPTRRARAAPAAPGLGLSIVKHAVQRHGGEVELWSRPGAGRRSRCGCAIDPGTPRWGTRRTKPEEAEEARRRRPRGAGERRPA
jgi:two-component system sensor histidine kinase SenX3